ncbi:ABC transporter permease [Portibacter lacus]|uniref:ABC transmembrane type-1 domain-containing protein n=1 Tax=Portibacter lacus TaxID=1099794 RepID=A0AA37SQE7_9BACT|nr:ABC transporter permease [Portibacter lacus]GLR17980.1 hypothetical protein GCM10007940_25950 [Portibacter lacus]
MKKRKLSYWIVGFYVFIAVFHPFIANENAHNFSILGKKFSISAPVAYSYNTIDETVSYSPPLKNGHLLGTDIIGRDTFAGILKGTEIAVKIGFLSVLLATILALCMGLFAAYSKINPFKIDLISGFLYLLSAICLVYYLWISSYTSYIYVVVALIFVVIINGGYQYLTRKKKKKWVLPIDGFYLRVVESMKALPSLILILACISIFEEFNVNGLILILAFLMWPGISRYVRAEALKVLSQEYILAAKAYGASDLRILWKHVLPKLFTSLSVIIAFSISAAILVESTLSFLGLGIPIDEVSWGTMLKEAQGNFSAWWLAIFPGIALFGLILSLNIIGEEAAQ